MYKIARFSVKYPTTIIMLVLAVILLGYISFSKVGMDLLPNMSTPRLFVELKVGEKPPEELETQYVEQLEAVAARGKNVKNVFSTSQVGQALITVEYDWEADMDEAFLDLQKSITDYSQTSGADEITVSQYDPNAKPIIIAVLSHPEITDLNQLRQTAENVIRNELIRLSGVASVEIVGARSKEIEILTDAYTLAAYGITLDQLTGTINSSNRNATAGSIVEMGRRYIIKGIGEFESLDDINNLIVAYKDTETATSGTDSYKKVPVYLREIADVRYQLTDAENIVRFDSQQSLALEIYKEAQYNTINASKSAREQLVTIEKSLPGYKIEIIQDQAEFIRSAIGEVEETGLVGIFLAVIVLFLFLRRIGVTLIISISIPISIIGTFNLLYFNDLTLNIMTLGGLALGAGMLVDNAIVVVENIFRHIESGKPIGEAAVLGVGEVGGAITSSTLTTIIVFLPIVYLHGTAGELFREQAWTVAFSLISSLFVALAVIPMLCSKLIKNRPETNKPNKTGNKFLGYRSFLAKILEKKKMVVSLGALAVIMTIALIPFVGSEFMPSSDSGDIYLELTLPQGTGLERTEGTVKSIEAIITEQYGTQIKHIFSKIGPTGTATDETGVLADENNAEIQLILNDETNVSQGQIVAALNRQLAEIPDVDIRIIQEQTALSTTLGTTTAPLVIEIKGDDLLVLADLADSVKSRIALVAELVNIETNFQDGRPEINIRIDRTVASDYSLTSEQIGSDLTDLLAGRTAGQMEYQGEYTDIKIRRPDVSLTDLKNILLESSDGQQVRLDEVAQMEVDLAPREIIRNNQSRVAEITSDIFGDIPYDKIVQKVKQAISGLAIPQGYRMNITGEEKLRRESFEDLKFALLLAIILVYMVMASQFESLLHPFVILLTIPLAAVGAVLLLFILGMPFNIMSYIGIIMLAGIAVNDSIILIDRINQNRRGGMELNSAIIDAGQTRIRPILITSITTILALLPLTIGIGEGASLRAPMAVAVIGGLISSTALTLIVIPAVYHLIAGKFKIRGESAE